MERNVADSLTYHIDLGHRVDQNYREDCNCQTKEEGAGKIPDYTSENRGQVGFIALIKDIFFSESILLTNISKFGEAG